MPARPSGNLRKAIALSLSIWAGIVEAGSKPDPLRCDNWLAAIQGPRGPEGLAAAEFALGAYRGARLRGVEFGDSHVSNPDGLMPWLIDACAKSPSRQVDEAAVEYAAHN